MGEDYGVLRTNEKELFNQVLKFRDFIKIDKLKQLIILYLFLKIPTHNYDIDDIVKFTKSTENRNVYKIIKSFRKQGWLVDIGTAHRKIIFTLPANRYREAMSYFFNRLFTVLYNYQGEKIKQMWLWEHWDMFSDILARNPVELHAYRVDWIKKNIEDESERATELLLLKGEKP